MNVKATFISCLFTPASPWLALEDCFILFEVGYYVAQAGLELAIPLPRLLNADIAVCIAMPCDLCCET